VRELAELLNSMREAGVISNYALFGATAQIRYTEPLATLDADVLVALPDPAGLDILRRLYAWPVQFIPVFNPLTAEALEQAETADFDGVPFRVVGAAHLAVIALSVGRGKDYASREDFWMPTSDPSERLDRQAAWQRSRRLLPWPVKIRMAEMAREAIEQLRKDAAQSDGKRSRRTSPTKRSPPEAASNA
jgi:hypothetical protein